MKILHVTNAVEWSGGMEQITLLISELQKRNHQNILVCPPDSKLIGKISNPEVQIAPVPMFQDYDLIAAYKLRQLIRRYSPDIVHAHHSIAHAVALLSLLFSNSPALVVSRRVSFPPRKNPFSRWKYKSKRINKYAVVSQAVKQTLINGGVDASKIEVIYSGVNPEKFFPCAPSKKFRNELHIPDHFSVVGKIANFSPWKGHHVFLEAAKRCVSKNPKIFFLLVGKETESLAPAVERLEIAASVKLMGFRKDVPEILSILNVSVNSAIEGEGLSGAMRESLMLEIPVVASDVAGNREIVREGETGFLVPPNDPVSLSEKILYALENYSQAKEMAKKGRAWVMQNATVEKMAEKHLQLYQSMIQSS